MKVRHDHAELESAELDPDYAGGLDHKLVRALRKVMVTVRGVPHEGFLVRHKGLNYKPLEGDRSNQNSMKLNDQWRLIVEIEKNEGPCNNVCAIKKIEDYHR